MAHQREVPNVARRTPRPARRASPNRAADIERLYERLTDGYQRIEEALADGQDVTAWEDFWIGLLHQYEALCDEAGDDLAKAS